MAKLCLSWVCCLGDEGRDVQHSPQNIVLQVVKVRLANTILTCQCRTTKSRIGAASCMMMLPPSDGNLQKMCESKANRVSCIVPGLFGVVGM